MLILKRNPSDDMGTYGILTLEDGTIYQTLELPWRNNESNISCIPKGTYKLKQRVSAKYNKVSHVWEVVSVPSRSDILIHYGNYISEIEGCILVGKTRTNTGGKKMVTSSVDTLKDMNNRMLDKEYTLMIV